MIPDFGRIKTVHLPGDILGRTGSILREAGGFGEEAFVLWAGYFRADSEFLVTTAIHPEQEAMKSPIGVGVYVDGEELFRINRWLFANEMVLLGQVHSHPTDAFHSDTDDRFPLVTAVGQFSVVVPSFARAPFTDLSRCAVFRLNSRGRWGAVPKGEVGRMFSVIHNGPR